MPRAWPRERAVTHDPEHEAGDSAAVPPMPDHAPEWEVLTGPGGPERDGGLDRLWRQRSRRSRAVIAVATVGVLALGGTVAYAATSGGTGSAAVPAAAGSPSGTPSPGGPGFRHGGGFGLGGAAVHGEATVKDDATGKWVVRIWQRGTVTKVDGDQVTVKSDDGTSWTWTVGADATPRAPPPSRRATRPPSPAPAPTPAPAQPTEPSQAPSTTRAPVTDEAARTAEAPAPGDTATTGRAPCRALPAATPRPSRHPHRQPGLRGHLRPQGPGEGRDEPGARAPGPWAHGGHAPSAAPSPAGSGTTTQPARAPRTGPSQAPRTARAQTPPPARPTASRPPRPAAPPTFARYIPTAPATPTPITTFAYNSSEYADRVSNPARVNASTAAGS